MSNISLSHLAFDRGIDRVTYTRQQEATQLPEREEALPPDLGGRAQLDALLSRPTLDDALDAAVRPLLENRDLLMPSRFGQALQSALQHLTDAAERTHDASTDQARTLNRAVRLLKEETGLRDLVQMYRSALYQG